MMNESSSIPLFPLNVVLFPGSKLPLYIFEDRYKKMINECNDAGSTFGINLFADNRIFNTGCTALIDRIVNTAETGEMNIICRGLKRYDLKKYQLTDSGYFKGDIDYLDSDVYFPPDIEKLEKTVAKYNELIMIVYKGVVKKIDLKEAGWYEGKKSAGFSMAEKCGLNIKERQVILETQNENDRLDYVFKYLEDVIPKLMQTDKISSIIKSDGYIQ